MKQHDFLIIDNFIYVNQFLRWCLLLLALTVLLVKISVDFIEFNHCQSTSDNKSTIKTSNKKFFLSLISTFQSEMKILYFWYHKILMIHQWMLCISSTTLYWTCVWWRENLLKQSMRTKGENGYMGSFTWIFRDMSFSCSKPDVKTLYNNKNNNVLRKRINNHNKLR